MSEQETTAGHTADLSAAGLEALTAVAKAEAKLEAMEALMIRWRIAAQRWTPGGSEFMDPKSCEAFIAARRQEAGKTKIDLVKAERENLALIEEVKRLRGALAWVTTALEQAEAGYPDKYADQAIALARAALPSNEGERG